MFSENLRKWAQSCFPNILIFIIIAPLQGEKKGLKTECALSTIEVFTTKYRKKNKNTQYLVFQKKGQLLFVVQEIWRTGSLIVRRLHFKIIHQWHKVGRTCNPSQNICIPFLFSSTLYYLPFLTFLWLISCFLFFFLIFFCSFNFFVCFGRCVLILRNENKIYFFTPQCYPVDDREIASLQW